MAAHLKYLYAISVMGILFLASCGDSDSAPPWEPWRDDSGDAAEAREGATEAAAYDDYLEGRYADQIATATMEAIDAMLATDDAARATEEAEAFATEDAEVREAEFEATMEVVDATADAVLATYEAGRTDCKGGCTDYPTWCSPIKGNVSLAPGKEGERIYHMPSDEWYEKTEIDPAYGEYYFCTPEEAEAAGFRRAYN